MEGLGKFPEEHFGPFLPYLQNDDVTDICWNGQDLWVDDIYKGRYKLKGEEVSPNMKLFVDQFSSRVANLAGVAFNQYDTLLETQIGLFRISIVHSYAAHTGTSVAIRRTSDKCRLEEEWCLENGYTTKEIWDFLPKIVKSGFSVIAGGLPGTGKTELLKLLSQSIPPYERAIVIEDSPEFHYRSINPESDCTEWKISETFTYEMALKASLRQRPDWNILAEARGREALYLMENFSSGLKVLTSTHLDEYYNLVSRMENMIAEPMLADRIKNEMYLRGICVAVLKRTIQEDGSGIKRHLDQLAFLSRENGEPTTTLIVDEGRIVNRELPPNILKKFKRAGFDDPLNCKERS